MGTPRPLVRALLYHRVQAGHLFDRASHFGVNSNLPLCFSGSEIRGIGALAGQEDCLKNFVPDRGDVE